MWEVFSQHLCPELGEAARRREAEAGAHRPLPLESRLAASVTSV